MTETSHTDTHAILPIVLDLEAWNAVFDLMSARNARGKFSSRWRTVPVPTPFSLGVSEQVSFFFFFNDSKLNLTQSLCKQHCVQAALGLRN